MKEDPLVSIIIPNYNGITHIIDFTYSLGNLKLKDKEIILVDNKSNDMSHILFKTLLPETKILKLRENVGFGEGVNSGIDISKGKYIVILNNDTFWDKDWIERGVDFLEKNIDYYFVSPLVLLRDRKTIDSAGDCISPLLSPKKILHGENIEYSNLREKDIYFSSCSAVILRREFFYRAGNFDGDYFMYFEDSDLFFRGFWIGLKGRFIPDLLVYHKEGGTIQRVKDGISKKHFFLFRNSLYLPFKNIPLSLTLFFSPFIFLHRVFLFLKWEKISNLSLFFKSLFAFFKDIKTLNKKRLTVLKKRKISYRKFFKFIFSCKI